MAADLLERLAAKAIGLGADALEIDYRSGFEEVFANTGSVGVCIARFRSSSKQATGLREACYRLARQKRPRPILSAGLNFDMRCTTYDSFGEDAFRLTLRPSSKARLDDRVSPRRARQREV